MTAGVDRPTYLFGDYLLKDIKPGTWRSITNGDMLALAFSDNDQVCFLTNRNTAAKSKKGILL